MKKAPKFTRAQLIWIIDCAMQAAIDRSEPMGSDVDHSDAAKSYIAGAIETAGMMVATLYAQTTQEGMAIGDALYTLKLREVVDKFRNHYDFKGWPDTTKLAEDFVDQTWKQKV